MQNRDETGLMVQVARMYYENDLTQEEIAEKLTLTRQKVSRLLIEARSQGIIRIVICDPSPADPNLGIEIKNRFGLHEVVLVSSEELEGNQLRAGLGLAAAEYLKKILWNDKLVGIGWGRTLNETVNLLGKNESQYINVIPLLGGIGDLAPSFQVNELARRLAEAFGGTYRHLYAPAFVQDDLVLERLLKTQEIEQVVNLWKHLDIAVVGIGHVEFQQISSMFFADHISPRTFAELEATGTVGDICARFYDITGKQVFPETGVIGIDLNQLGEVPEVIAIAGGLEKMRAILGALRGGYIKTLITDTATARAVLTEDNERRRYYRRNLQV